MMITKERTTTYKVSMTEAQAVNLVILLRTGKDAHINELSVQAEYGSEVANDVRETCCDLLYVLEERNL